MLGEKRWVFPFSLRFEEQGKGVATGWVFNGKLVKREGGLGGGKDEPYVNSVGNCVVDSWRIDSIIT